MLQLNTVEGNKCSSSGFSLVEVSLAIMIVGIGMLAIIGMFPAGLDQNSRAISDTHAALFAGEVFSALRVQAETNWDGLGQDEIPAAMQAEWGDIVNLRTLANNTIYTNRYGRSGNTNIADHTFRYRITLTTNGLIKSAFLRFWPGEYGSISNPIMFYSEFFKLTQ